MKKMIAIHCPECGDVHSHNSPQEDLVNRIDEELARPGGLEISIGVVLTEILEDAKEILENI